MVVVRESAPDRGYAVPGVRPLINVAGRYTRFGGSVMPEPVVVAMTSAAACHVDMVALQRAVGDRLAEITHNDGAYVTVGAAAGIALSVLACATGDDEVAVRRVTEGRHAPFEVVVQRGHRVPYLPALRLAGATVVEVGSVTGTDEVDLAAGITEQTVAVLYVAGAHLSRGALGLPDAVAVADAHGVPVIVDAAAQLPPVDNLWRFTRTEGAALALFSGGKDLCGPQASGLVVGRADLIEAIRLHGSPHQRLARAMKTGKEEIVGLLAAVERYLALDHDARRNRWDQTLATWHAALTDLAAVTVRRVEQNEAGQPIPRLLVSWPDGPTTSDVVAALLAGDPPVAVAHAGSRTVGLTPETVSPLEIPLVADALHAQFGGRLA